MSLPAYLHRPRVVHALAGCGSELLHSVSRANEVWWLHWEAKRDDDMCLVESSPARFKSRCLTTLRFQGRFQTAN